MIEDNVYMLYRRAIDKWGREAQIGMLIEEMGELLTAINKFNRKENGCDYFQVIEEIADVEIMLDQYKMILADIVGENIQNPFDDVEREKLDKFKRLMGRVYVGFDRDQGNSE